MSSPRPRNEPPGGFSPPAPDRVEAHLDAFPFEPMGRWRRLAPLAPSGFGLGAYLAAPGWITALILLASVAAGLSWSAWRMRRAKRRQTALRRVHESAMLRRYGEATRGAWTLLPLAREDAAAYAGTVLALGRCLGELRCDAAAIVCFDRLLAHTPPGHPAAVHFAVLRAVGALFDDRLAEADETIRKLRDHEAAAAKAQRRGATAREDNADAAAGVAPPRIAEGGVAFARLLQSAKTYRVDELIDDADTVVDRLRPLGVDAGYGYALTAWAFDQRRRQPREGDDAEALAAQARRWWGKATTLLPASVLAYRLPETASLAGFAAPAVAGGDA